LFCVLVLNSIEEGWQVDSVYTDFLKAFDRVRHQLLLEEMSVGIKPARFLWLRSYLTGRMQRIRIGGAVSKDGDIGCPTGESSRTIVFHLVCQQNIDDFRIRPCADDMKLFLPLRPGFSRLYENLVRSEQSVLIIP
jgi:hypothetical protein